MAGLNWLAVTVSALAVFILGWLWYGPLFSKPWASGMGFQNSGSDAKMPPPAMLFMSYLMSFFLATALASILGAVQFVQPDIRHYGRRHVHLEGAESQEPMRGVRVHRPAPGAAHSTTRR